MHAKSLKLVVTWCLVIALTMQTTNAKTLKPAQGDWASKKPQNDSDPKIPLRMEENSHCPDGMSHFSQGDFNLTKQNFEKYYTSKTPVIVGISARWCQYCCRYEQFYHDFSKRLASSKKLAKIKLARLDISTQSWFQQRFSIEEIPGIVVIHQGQVHVQFNHYWDAYRLIYFLKKINRPIRRLKTLKQIENFLTREELDYDGDLVRESRVIGFLPQAYVNNDTKEDSNGTS